MAILKINGSSVPNPSEFSISYVDFSSSEAGRTQTGKMVKDVIAKKVSLQCKWNTLNWTDASTLLQAVEDEIFMTVRYPDAKAGGYITKTFYVGDRSAPAIMLANGKEYWDGISFSFIER